MNIRWNTGRLAWIAAAAFLATILHSPICGAQARTVVPRPSNPAVQTAPKPPAAATTAPNETSPPHDTKPIFDPAIVAGLAKNWQKPDFKTIEAELNNAEKDLEAKRVALGSAQMQMAMRAGFCSQFKYSAEDQKKAGCMANDTVSQCTQKLFSECMKAGHVDYVGKKAQLLASVARMEKALKEYSAALGPTATSKAPGPPGTVIAP